MNQFNNIFTAFGWIGFVTCLIVLMFFRGCQAPEIKSVETRTIKIYDSTRKLTPAVSLPVQTYSYAVMVPANVDTGAILRQYFSVFTYSQTFQDSSYRAEIIDTITQNRIKGRKFTYQQLSPVKTIESTTVTLQSDQIGIYVGADVGLSANRYCFAPRLSFLTKKELLISAGYDLINKQVNAGLQLKLWPKKRK